jgi:hypothetical protein
VPPPEPRPRLGIAATPQNGNNVVEMDYDNVSIFKKLVSLLKNMNVKEININFEATHVKMFGIDHSEKNLVNIRIASSKLTHYYCEHPTSVQIDTKNLDTITQKIDKHYDLFSFILKRQSYRQHLIVVLQNKELCIDESHVINLVENDANVSQLYARGVDYNLYPLKFELPSKYFKKLICDIIPFSEVFTIEQVNSNLQFIYKNLNNTIKGYNICKDSTKINLSSSISADGIFSVSTPVNYIKPIANSLLSDKIKIFADYEKDLVFNVAVDEGAVDVLLYVTINRFT